MLIPGTDRYIRRLDTSFQTTRLTQRQIAELFDVDVRTISEHLGNVFSSGELEREATIRKFRIVRSEGSRQVTRSIDHYNLDAIISVGYRVNSVRATQFRQWGTSVLRDFAIRGYVIDRQRLEQPSQAARHKRRAQVSESTK